MSPVKDRQCKAAKGRCRAAKGHWHCHGCNATKLHEHFTKWIIRFGLSRETRTRCDLCTTAREEARQSAKGHWHCRGCDTIKLHEDFAMWITRFGLSQETRTRCDLCTTVREEVRQSTKGHWHCRGCDTIKPHEDFAMWIIRFGLCRRGAKTKCDSCTTAVWREFRPRLSKTSQLHVAHDQPQISRDHCKRAKGTLNPPPF